MKNNYLKKGFTLIELLVVVAIIGMLASVILVASQDSRNKGVNAAVKSNLGTVRALSEIFFLDNSNSYLPAGGSIFNPGVCPVYNASGSNMLSKHADIAKAIAEATRQGGANYCANASNVWAVAVSLKLDTVSSWCVDNQGSAKVVAGLPSVAIDSNTFLCN